MEHTNTPSVTSSLRVRPALYDALSARAAAVGLTVRAFIALAVERRLQQVEVTPPLPRGRMARGKSFGLTFNTSLPLYARMEKAAAQAGCSMADVVRRCLSLELDVPEMDPPRVKERKAQQFAVTLPFFLHTWMRQRADRGGPSVSEQIRDAIDTRLAFFADPTQSQVHRLSAPTPVGGVAVALRLAPSMHTALKQAAKARQCSAATLARLCAAQAVKDLVTAAPRSTHRSSDT